MAGGFATGGFATGGFATGGFATGGFATGGFAAEGFAGMAPFAAAEREALAACAREDEAAEPTWLDEASIFFAGWPCT